MGRSKGGMVKTMKISPTSDSDMNNLTSMFNVLMGLSDADRDILLPKIVDVYKSIVAFNKLYSILLSFDSFTKMFSEYQFWFDEISEFLQELNKSTNTDITKNYDVDHNTGFHELDNAELNVFYKKLIDNSHIKNIIITANNLSLYKKYLFSEEKDYSFVNKEPGITFKPLSYTSLDLKIIWASDITDIQKKFILSILRRTYESGIKLYDIVTSPNIDIKAFSKKLISIISQLKKQIPRCDRAFAIIEKSVTMLENNFKSYFKNSVEASNPSIIIESFILDISSSQKSASTAGEFRRIMSFLKQHSAAKNNSDPRLKKLFSMLNKQFSNIDNELGVKVRDDTEASSSGSTSAKNKQDLKDQKDQKDINTRAPIVTRESAP